MGKYDPLGVFLRRWKVRNAAEGVELGFTHIESIIGGLLPRGAAEPQWWGAHGDDPRSSPHRRAEGRARLFPQANRALTAR